MRRPAADRVCDFACLLFAALTIGTHCVVALGGNGRHLFAVSGAISLLAIAACIAWARHRQSAAVRLPQPSEVSESQAETAPDDQRSAMPLYARLLGGVVGLSALLVYSQNRDVVGLWWAIMAVLVFGAAMLFRGAPPARESARPNRRAEMLLWCLAVACAVFTLVCHRPAVDDAYYVNVAVAVVDHPESALYQHDTMHGIAGLPLLSPIYRVHSYELLNGVLSIATGIPAIACLHWISACVAALLVPLCFAYLFRILTPRDWLWGVIACVVILVANGDLHRSYGNYAFVKLWQGKAIFATALLPLIYAYALRHAARPTRVSWLLLFSSQISAIGLTSTAIWIAPFSAGLALLAGASLDRKGLRAIATGVLASVYAVGAGLVLRGDIKQAIAGHPEPPSAAGHQLVIAFDRVLGDGRFELLAVAAILVTWTLWRGGVVQRFAILVPLGAFALVGNPYLERLIVGQITGSESLYWRIFWLIPVPILMSLMLCSPLRWRWTFGGQPAMRWVAPGLVVSALVLLVFAVSHHPTFVSAPGLGVRVGEPKLKVPQVEFEWAERLNNSVPPGSIVIAPNSVNAWIPTMHGHSHPVEVRRLYTDSYQRRKLMSQKDVELRNMLTLCVSGGSQEEKRRTEGCDVQRFADGLRQYAVAAVCMRKNSTSEQIRRDLLSEGFERVEDGRRFEIWRRLELSG